MSEVPQRRLPPPYDPDAEIPSRGGPVRPEVGLRASGRSSFSLDAGKHRCCEVETVETLYPASCTLHPEPCTLNSEPETLNLQP